MSLHSHNPIDCDGAVPYGGPSASHVKKLLADHSLRPKKRLGQNFLIDGNTLDRIIAACGVGPGDNVLEIGPGLGVVTRRLAEAGGNVVCVEADKALEPILRDALAHVPNAEIVLGDFLKLELPGFLGAHAAGRWMVVGNLPYYITSPIITKLIDSRRIISRMVLMVQREVALRLAAKPGSDDYGALSVYVQFYCDIESVMRVSRNVFYPIPDVDSELVRLTARKRPRAVVEDERLFFAVVRSAFGKRRKTLFNALASSLLLGWTKDKAGEALESARIDGNRRGETLSIEEFAAIADAAAKCSDRRSPNCHWGPDCKSGPNVKP
ncbi:MAG: hypothetical protein A2Z18_10765 [Armatimonadetes bacterium RBG_16_58_9]|nr:MAG: hypothetical protein A2Z18_10765 [Armatimonadetes bacterium RBG_16_58_9]